MHAVTHLPSKHTHDRAGFGPIRLPPQMPAVACAFPQQVCARHHAATLSNGFCSGALVQLLAHQICLHCLALHWQLQEALLCLLIGSWLQSGSGDGVAVPRRSWLGAQPRTPRLTDPRAGLTRCAIWSQGRRFQVRPRASVWLQSVCHPSTSDRPW